MFLVKSIVIVNNYQNFYNYFIFMLQFPNINSYILFELLESIKEESESLEQSNEKNISTIKKN